MRTNEPPVEKFVDNSLDTLRMEAVTMPRGGSMPPALRLAGAFPSWTPCIAMVSRIPLHACQGAHSRSILVAYRPFQG